MREILFRGQDIRGVWHIGLIAHIGNAWYISNNAGVATAYEVIPATIGEYSGLTDKNGKRIFEGDILRYNRYRYSVIFEEGAFNCDGFLDNSMDCPYCAFSQGTHHFEVIGNIHDNPELMDGKP